MNYLQEPEPARGVAIPVASGIRRLVAPNPGPMTYRGTNTYLLDWPGGIAVVDPGPDDEAHIDAVLAAAGAPIRAILITHSHHDHVGGLAALRAATGAPVSAWHDPADPTVAPDLPLRDGDAAGDWRAVHTPGHAPDHLCFLGRDDVLLSGDHVMSWSSTVVGPPAGNMTDYFGSLHTLLRLPSTLYLPGHGPPLPEPTAFVAGLLEHRREREATILRALGPNPASAAEIVERAYPGIDPSLRRAAERTVVAHLQKLRDDGRAAESDGWVARAGDR